ncbi:hypothetical protein ACIGW8_03790 [Streptomyces sioyaensis]|uniref:hypothetical protein n=1 Tax=Streptomyces sioyaensis TaxID=67364 RepID=UPI0037CD63AF
MSVPHTWLNVPMDPESVGEWLPQGRVVDRAEASHLMATDLYATDPMVPEGYTAALETRDEACTAGGMHVPALSVVRQGSAPGRSASPGAKMEYGR